jgi:hypothetical protein
MHHGCQAWRHEEDRQAEKAREHIATAREFVDETGYGRRKPEVAELEGNSPKSAKTGAGEGIRTLDPNLGKVVLYP